MFFSDIDDRIIYIKKVFCLEGKKQFLYGFVQKI